MPQAKKTTQPALKKTPVPEVTDDVPEVTVNDFFKNESTNNVFTTVGRCSPGQIVFIPVDEAELIKGLKLCQMS